MFSYLPTMDLRRQATKPVAAFPRQDLFEVSTWFGVGLVVAWQRRFYVSLCLPWVTGREAHHYEVRRWIHPRPSESGGDEGGADNVDVGRAQF
jgi:hypothetical protein